VEGVDLKGSAMTNRSPNAVRSLVALRRLARRLRGVGLSAAWLAGVGAAGAAESMRKAYPRPPRAAPGRSRPPATPVPEARLAVAVVLGASGTVITDAFGPYQVFARSSRFLVYTVSASHPAAMLSGGLAVVPDYSLEEVDAGVAPEPDVVVVPAVAAPNGKREAPLRDWITRRSDRGAHLLGVCNGSRLLAAAGLLDGRRATAHWSAIRGLERRRPQVDWVRGQRYVQDGTLTTTAGVTSGVFGALRLVEQLAGAGEAQRVGQELAYPGWSLHGPTEIGAQRWAPGDLAYLLAAAFPWLRPTVGVGLVEGVGELEVAAPFEVYASSFAARTVPIAAEATVRTRHGLRLVATPTDAIAPDVDRLLVPGAHTTDQVDSQLLGWAADRGLKVELPNGGQAAGQFSFDAMLGDLAGHSDQMTARVTAKTIEYPTEQLELAGAGWPWRPTALLALTAAAAVAIGLVPAVVTRRNRR
jgi:putative intracellular protease/amidase